MDLRLTDEQANLLLAELDPFRLSVHMQVTRVVFQVGVKAMLDGTLGRQAALERDRDRILGELMRELDEDELRAQE